MTAAYYYDRNWDKKKQERKRVVVTGIGSVTPTRQYFRGHLVKSYKGHLRHSTDNHF